MRFAYSQVENLNEAEMCVYNYVVKNLKHILNLSVRELADEVMFQQLLLCVFVRRWDILAFQN